VCSTEGPLHLLFLDEIRAGREVLFVSGYVRYRDVFGRNHETRYGLRYRAAEVWNRDYDGFLVGGPKRYNNYS
jgi:hypothetical protein